MELSIAAVAGTEAAPHLEAVAGLRIRVFREFPYLYDGSEEYERDYLAAYTESPGSVIVLAMADGAVVGASTGLPLADAEACFREPWERAGEAVERVFYLGESVLLPEWRGRGIGHAFFDERELHARRLGFGEASFCAVERPQDHPARPTDYRTLEPFWEKRGYRRDERLIARMPWQQVDVGAEVENRLVFWRRSLL